MTKHAATLALTQALLEPPGGLPSGHLARINALQSKKGKANLSESDLVARPVRLTGDQITAIYTRFPEAELQRMASQVNDEGAPLLSAHITDERPIGTYYAAEVTAEDGGLWLDTWAYWLADDVGLKLARDIDAGVVNEASIGWWYSEAICSVCNSDWYGCGHWPGETYTVTDPATQVAEERMCFRWTLGCEIAEGSIVYRGAHPDTKVGGTIAAPNPVVAQAVMHPTRFQAQASKEMLGLFEKAKPKSELGKPVPSAEPEEREEGLVKIKLALLDGSEKDLEPNEVQATLEAERLAAGKGGEQKQREAVAAALGLEPKDVTDAKLAELKAQAKAGEAYMKSLEARLSKAAIALGDDEKKAARIVRLAKGGTLQDLEETVEDYEAKRDALVPDGQLSKRNDGEGKKRKPDFESV